MTCFARNARINFAISSPFVSRAKWPASSRWYSSVSRSRRYGSAPADGKIGSFFPLAISIVRSEPFRSSTTSNRIRSPFRSWPDCRLCSSFTFTAVCQGELCSLRDDIGRFEAANAQVYGVSCDSSHAQKKWAEEQGFTFPLLSDFWPHGEISRAYGVFNDALGAAMRATFVIDKEGAVTAAFQSADLKTPRAQEDYEKALAELP